MALISSGTKIMRKMAAAGVPKPTVAALMVMLAGLVLVTGCGGGLSRSDAALFSRALGEEVRDRNYSKIDGDFDPKQAALAEQSGMKVEDVGQVMAGVQIALVGNYALDADFPVAAEVVAAIKSSEKLNRLATNKLERWLLDRRKAGVPGRLKDFLEQPGQEQLEDLLKVASDKGLEYGFFAGAGTFWFREPKTGDYVTVTLVDLPVEPAPGEPALGEQVMVVMEGVGQIKEHPRYQVAIDFQVTIDSVQMWRDSKEEPPPRSKAKCCNGPSSGINGNRLEVITLLDTNEDANDLLFDPAGFGDAAYIAKDQVISYTIRFENQADASAAAIDVTVIAELSPGFDLASFLLGRSSHPDVVTTEIDDSTGTITWFFKDIILPPNEDRPEGAGWVKFSAQPKANVKSGDTIWAKAAIRFDYNPPTETNQVRYTIDSESPTSQVDGLAPVQLSTSFTVSWTGSDEESGSGLQGITLLVSEDGAPFDVVGAFTDSAFQFQGEAGKSYGFVTIGVDQVGHTESMPDIADVTVTVGQHMSMEPGWRLIGVPVITDKSPREELVRVGTRWSTWDSAAQAYQKNAAADGQWLANSQELPGSGLWANFEAGTEFYITGDSPPADRAFSIDLLPGWNLIANPFALPVPWNLDEIHVRSAGPEMTLAQAQEYGLMEDFAWGWNGEAYSLVYDSKLSTGQAAVLEPFQGYWVQAHEEVTLVLPPPTLGRD
ncbi:MAG: hypothetical protein IIC33_04750 [Chloroflexi bacterium]|nr:hypothetical protein [Chloroflexota bacterium]